MNDRNRKWVEEKVEKELPAMIQEALEEGEPLTKEEIEQTRKEMITYDLIFPEYEEYLVSNKVLVSEFCQRFSEDSIWDIPRSVYEKILAEYQKTGKPKQSVRKVLKKYLNPKKAKK